MVFYVLGLYLVLYPLGAPWPAIDAVCIPSDVCSRAMPLSAQPWPTSPNKTLKKTKTASITKMHAPLTTRRSALISLTATLTACTINTDYNHDAADAPRSLLTKANKPIKNIWVLSSGGPRGFVHVGILKALEELGHKPDMIVGGSVGSLVGALYAGGVKARELEQMSLDLGVTDMGRLALTGEGKFAGSPLAEIVNRELLQRCGTCEMEKLPVRFAAAVIDRTSRQPMLFNHGNAGVAVQASCAIEGTFTPVRIRGVQYVDADLVAPMPVRMARAWAAALGSSAQTIKVIAMDASAHENKAPEGAVRYREGDLRKRALTHPDAQAADLTLHPEMSYYVNVSKEFRERTMAQGYAQTMAQAARLRAVLG
jgi:NTE family protein